MRINDLGSGGARRPEQSVQKLNELDAARVDNADNKAGSKTEIASSSYVRDSKVKQLVQLLNQSPEIRQDVVATAREQLHKGEFSTREAIDNTARAILGIE